MSGPRVAVVGGGLAGVSAALALADGGAEVTLFERRTKLGGLTWSFSRHGLWFDNGQHVFLRCCTAYRGFLDRIGATEYVVLQPRLDVPVLAPGGISSSITRVSLPPPLHLARSLVGYRHLTMRERALLVRPVLALKRLSPDDPSLDTLTFGAWLERHGQTRHAIEHLWDLITLPTLNVPASEASLALAVKVFRTGLLDTADGGDIGWATVPLQRLHGENAASALDAAGVEVRLGARVEGVVPVDDGGLAIVDPEGQVVVDAAVVATPPEVTTALVPNGIVPPVAGLGASPIVNVHLVLDRTVTDLPMAAAVDSPIQYVFDRTVSSGLAASSGVAASSDGVTASSSGVAGSSDVAGKQCLSISLSAADRYIGQHPDELVRSFRQALDDLFPAARHARLVDGTVSREHTATFRAVPGTAALRPPARTAIQGLALAGAWCDTGWPATMEGAVRSGLSAASVILSDVGTEPTSLLTGSRA